MILIGNHMLKAYTCNENIIARSRTQSELYTAALGAFESEGMVSLLCSVWPMKPELAIDGKPTDHILHRQGIGRLKNIDVAHLWTQDDV